MEIEQLEIRKQLELYPPFSSLPSEELDLIAQTIEIGYFKAGTDILETGQSFDDLHIIRSGAVEVYRRDGSLFDRLTEGGVFGHWGLLLGKKVRFPAKALEDTLIYFLPSERFEHLFSTYDVFAHFMEIEDSKRLQKVVSKLRENNDFLTSTVSRLLTRPPVTIAPNATIQEAAKLMAEESVSSLLILKESNLTDQQRTYPQEKDFTAMVGIVTDRDFRIRCLAEGVPYDRKISDIMTTNLISIDGQDYIFEAMLAMLRYNIHHLPVLRRGKPLGVIALSDIVRYESHNSLFVVSQIFRSQTLSELQKLTAQAKTTFLHMVSQDPNSRIIGSAMAAIGRSFKQRIIELAEDALGPPPIPYCFLALGSMARSEQLIVTDQDNAMILDNQYDPAIHYSYFKDLAQWITQALDSVGYPFCSGNIMASNDQWRQPLHVWEDYFKNWIQNPTPETLLNSSIFFDLEGVAGEITWAEQLQTLITERAPKQSKFLSAMAHNALMRKPPLGFFKNFVLEKDGNQRPTINLKSRGMAPLTDLIRVHALSVGSTAQNSFDRLNDIDQAKILNPGIANNLRDALEFISMVRIRHQAIELELNQTPDNNLIPEDLSSFERRSLKDAFQVLSNAQDYLKFRYHPNRNFSDQEGIKPTS